ncbi:helix-turn-helix domain-containing protein [Providencia rettgeri]
MIGDNTQNNLFSFFSGLVIRKLRRERGISGMELAKQLNISQQQMSRYERGVNKFSIDMLFNILIILGVPFEYFLKLLIIEIKYNESSDFLVFKERISTLDLNYFY